QGPGDQEVDGDRHPDQRGTHGGQQGQECHRHAPEQGALDAQECKHQAAQQSLGGGDDDVALYRGAHHGGEFLEQAVAVRVLERDQAPEPRHDDRTVAQQEEQQVQHDAQPDHELEGVLADVDRLLGQELAGLQGAGGELFADAEQIAQAEGIQPAVHGRRQGAHDLLVVAAQVQLTGIDAGIQPGDLVGERGGDEQHRQDHDQRDAQQRQECSQVGAAPPQQTQQAPVQGVEDHRQHAAPEDRRVEGQQDADESDRDGGQQQQEAAEVQGGHGREVVSGALVAPGVADAIGDRADDQYRQRHARQQGSAGRQFESQREHALVQQLEQAEQIIADGDDGQAFHRLLDL